MAASKKARTRIVRVVVVVLAVIGGITVVDNTYRLGRAVLHTVTSFHFSPPHIVAGK